MTAFISIHSIPLKYCQKQLEFYVKFRGTKIHVYFGASQSAVPQWIQNTLTVPSSFSQQHIKLILKTVSFTPMWTRILHCSMVSSQYSQKTSYSSLSPTNNILLFFASTGSPSLWNCSTMLARYASTYTCVRVTVQGSATPARA
jgi:hypothetical protein